MNNKTIEDMKNIANERNGKCLSKKYPGPQNNLIWKCNKDNHKWLAPYSNISRGTWCPKCAGVKKLNMNYIRKYILKRGGKLLSNVYNNAHTPLKIKCKYGHKWITSYMSIRSGHWCSICSKNKKLDINDMYNIANKMLGQCLSNKYVNANGKLLWRCKEGHEWFAKYGNIYLGKWCPYCASRNTEKLCTQIFEKITGKKFKKVRPKCLKGLELDGYNEELKLAFEYNGKQHYFYNSFMHKNRQDFFDMCKRDKKKIDLCKRNKIKLIIIPYTFNIYHKNKLERYIINKLKLYK